MSVFIAIVTGAVCITFCLVQSYCPKHWQGWMALVGFVCGFASEIAWMVAWAEALRFNP